MISDQLEAEILRLFLAEKWRVGTIATQLGLHRDTVKRVLTQAGAPRAMTGRGSTIDLFLPFIKQTLEKYPTLPASRLYQMCRDRSHKGSQDHFRHYVAMHRPRRSAEAFLRLETLPGEQAQVDWGHFGTIQIGRAIRRLLAFVMVLSWSRRIFLRFYLGACGANFLRGHMAAFQHFGGVPRQILYDNLKSAVIERVGDAIRFNSAFLDFAKCYSFEPKPVAPARGNEKGRVERGIRYVRTSFFPARDFDGVEDLNGQALIWCDGVAMERRWRDGESSTVADAVVQERERLLSLPDNPSPIDEMIEVSVGKTPYARFDWNDYSVPHTRAHRTLVVRASLTEVRIFDGHELVATHQRSFDSKAVIEDPTHIAALVEAKRKAHASRGLDVLRRVAPCAEELYQRLAERGGNLGHATSRLMQLLDEYGAERLDRAIAEALSKGVLHHYAIRQILERERDASGQPPPIPVALPDDPRIKDLAVRPHDLSSYDKLGDLSPDDETEPEAQGAQGGAA